MVEGGAASSEQKRVCARRATISGSRTGTPRPALLLMPFSSQESPPQTRLKNSSGAEPRDVEQPSPFFFESRVQSCFASQFAPLLRPFSAAWRQQLAGGRATLRIFRLRNVTLLRSNIVKVCDPKWRCWSEVFLDSKECHIHHQHHQRPYQHTTQLQHGQEAVQGAEGEAA